MAKKELVVLSLRVTQETKDTIETLYKDLPIKGRPSSVGAMVRKDLEELYGK